MQHACTSAEGSRTTSGAVQSNRTNSASATPLGPVLVYARYPTTKYMSSVDAACLYECGGPTHDERRRTCNQIARMAPQRRRMDRHNRLRWQTSTRLPPSPPGTTSTTTPVETRSSTAPSSSRAWRLRPRADSGAPPPPPPPPRTCGWLPRRTPACSRSQPDESRGCCGDGLPSLSRRGCQAKQSDR
jgi:hypothetical protein